MSPELWTAKEITTLLLQGGALGLCFLMMLMGVYLVLQMGNKFLEKLDRLSEKIAWFGSLLVDHKARAGDTPPSRVKV